MAETIYVGAGGYSSLAEAVQNAASGDTIIVKAGTYAEDYTFGASTPDNLTIKAEGDVTFTGTLTIDTGYNNKAKNLVIDGIDFVADGNCLVTKVAYGITVQNCSFTSTSGANCINDTSQKSGKGNILFDNCVINDPVQIYGGNLTDGRAFEFANCKIYAKVNIQSGYETKFTDCDFEFTVTDAANGDNFYGIRSNTTPVIIEGGTVKVDSTVTDAVPGEKDWAVFWQRQNSTNQWAVSGLEVTYTDAAKANGNLLFNNNVDPAHNTRVSFDDTCVIPEDALANSSGMMSVGGVTYSNGNEVNGKVLYVNNTWTETTVPAGKTWAVDAFADIQSAVDAFADGDVIAVAFAQLGEDIKVNEDGAKNIIMTGAVDNTSSAIRIYGNAVLDGFDVNGGYTGTIVSGKGRVNVYGDTTITGDTVMNLNAFQTTNSGVIDSDVVINTANFNAYDSESDGDAKFVVKGTLNTVSFIVTNDLYSAGNDELIVAEDGVVTATYMSGNGRLSLQTGAVTVYGYLGADLSSGGGRSNFGSGEGYAMNLTVDGTYAAEGNNNGKLIKTGNQELDIKATSQLNVVNGAEFSWEGKITANDSAITVTDSKFTADTLTGSTSFDVAGNSTLQFAGYTGNLITLAGGTVLTDTAVAADEAAVTKIVAKGDLTINANAFTNFDIITVAGDLTITGADLSSDGYVLSGDVRVSGDVISVNGLDVVNGKFNDGKNVYSVVEDTAGIKITQDAVIAELSGKVTGYAQTVGESYLFTLNCTAEGGEGDKVYSVEVYNNGELVDVVTSSNANGVKFALASIPTYDNITVDVFVSDKYNTVQIADDYKVEVVDYTAPKFNVKVAGAEVSAVDADEKANDVTISWGASDNFAVTGYIVDINGEKSYFDGSVTSMDLKDLANGDYAVKVTAIDAAGNQKVSQTDFSVKVVRPVAEQAAVVNDFDGDAKSDAIEATVPVFKVLGSAAADAVTGEFKNAAVGIVEDGWEVLGTGYFNEDNVADVLIQNKTTGEIEALFVEYADGKFAASQEALEMDMTGWTFAGIGDVNGDGIDDIIASKAHDAAFDENSNKVADAFVEYAAFESQYDGSFKQTSSLGGIGTDAADWSVIGLSDMDGDNKDDVVWMNSASQEIGYWASSAKEGTNPWVSLAAGAADWTFAGIGDFDGDSKSELLWTYEDGLIGYWQESAAGTDEFFTSLGSTSEMEGFTIDAIGDYNGDGIDDILWSADNGEKKAWLINSDNTHTVSIIAC